ncbi:DUF4113 domain-containing protein [Plesiomonas shigelloides]|nr:DUF4113 domain-containing protein [Plesiomonas shigelloides]
MLYINTVNGVQPCFLPRLNNPNHLSFRCFCHGFTSPQLEPDSSEWMMKRERLSPRYTTSLSDIPIVS